MLFKIKIEKDYLFNYKIIMSDKESENEKLIWRITGKYLVYSGRDSYVLTIKTIERIAYATNIA